MSRRDELRQAIVAAAGGDLDAFSRLVARFQDAVFASAYARLKDRAQAEDAAQEVFLEAHRQLADLREPAAFTAWLRTIVAKHCDRVLRRRRPEHVPCSEAVEVAACAADPGDLVDRGRAYDRLREAVAALPDGERLVFLHTDVADQSAAEAAAFLDLPLSTVKKRLHVARRRLAGRLGEAVREILREGRPSRTPRFAGRIELFLALRAGDRERVDRLLDAEPGLVDAEEDWEVDEAIANLLPFPLRATPLIRAAEQGDREMARRLLARGADANRRCGCSTNETALFAAAVTSRVGIVSDLLAAGADVESATAGGIRPIHVAAMRGDRALVDLLVSAGADLAARDGGGRSAADWARERGWADFAIPRITALPDRAASPPCHREVAALPSVDRLFGCALDASGRVIEGAPSLAAPTGDGAARAGHPPAPCRAERGAFWETGIKAIDLLAPLPMDGCVRVYGGRRRTGAMILLLELVHRAGRAVIVGWEHLGYERIDTLTALQETATRGRSIVVYAARGESAVGRRRAWEIALRLSRDAARAGEHLMLIALEPDDRLEPMLAGSAVGSSAPVTAIVAARADVRPPADAGAERGARLSLSPRLATAMLFPALDAAGSVSPLLVPEVVGDRHCRLASLARGLLARAEEVDGVRRPSGAVGAGADGRVDAERARRLRAYLTQPFFCTEPFSGRPGVSVARARLLDDVEAILSGRWDQVAPEDLLYAPAEPVGLPGVR